MADEESNYKIIINIKTTSEERPVEVEENATVIELKEEVAKQYGITVEQVHLIFAGKILNDHEEIKKRNIKNGRTVFLVIKNKNKPPQEARNISSTLNEVSPMSENSSESDIMSALGELNDLFNIINNPVLSNMQQEVEGESTNSLERIRHFLNNTVHSLFSNPETLRDTNSVFSESSPLIRNILQELREQLHLLCNESSPFVRLMEDLTQTDSELTEFITHLASNPEHQQQIQDMMQDIFSDPERSIPENFFANPTVIQSLVQVLRGLSQLHQIMQQITSEPQRQIAEFLFINPTVIPLLLQILGGLSQLYQIISTNTQTSTTGTASSTNDANTFSTSSTTDASASPLSPTTGTASSTTDTITSAPSSQSNTTSTLPNLSENSPSIVSIERFLRSVTTTITLNEALPEERYQSQLDQLASMGFVNRDVNLQTLITTSGNISATVERLLRSPWNNSSG